MSMNAIQMVTEPCYLELTLVTSNHNFDAMVHAIDVVDDSCGVAAFVAIADTDYSKDAVVA